MPGTGASAAEVTDVSRHGFCLLQGGKKLLLPFADFPWFRKASIGQLCDVQWPTPEHLYWPHLDVDHLVESIRNPGAVPRVAAG